MCVHVSEKYIANLYLMYNAMPINYTVLLVFCNCKRSGCPQDSAKFCNVFFAHVFCIKLLTCLYTFWAFSSLVGVSTQPKGLKFQSLQEQFVDNHHVSKLSMTE